MRTIIKNFALFFGGLGLVHVIVELPYSLYIGEKFEFPLRSILYYLTFSTVYVLYKLFRSKNKADITN